MKILLEEAIEAKLISLLKLAEDASAQSITTCQKEIASHNIQQKLDLQLRYLSTITREIQSHAAQVAKQRNTLQTAHRIPQEIWDTIFNNLVSPIESSSARTRKLSTLGSVCHRWREIVLRAPRLWAVISGVSCSASAEKAIERSRRASLTIKYSHWISSAVVSAVLPQLNRCKTIEVKAGPGDANKLLGALVRDGATARLEELSIASSGCVDRVWVEGATSLRANKLKRLSLGMLHCSRIENFVVFAPQLTQVTLMISHSMFLRPDPLRQFLSNIPSLETLALTADTKQVTDLGGHHHDQAISPLPLPKLEKVTIEMHSGSVASALLRAIESP
ncbi:hypothetical protein FRC03_006317, partial [Tulasnella sp. 419]